VQFREATATFIFVTELGAVENFRLWECNKSENTLSHYRRSNLDSDFVKNDFLVTDRLIHAVIISVVM